MLSYIWRIESVATGQLLVADAVQDSIDVALPDANYLVSLIVTDDDGGINSDLATFTAVNATPLVNLGEGNVAIPAAFTDPNPFGEPLAFLWQVESSNDQEIAESKDATFVFTPADDGIDTVTLTVTDDQGEVGTNSVTVTVNNVAPIADLGDDFSVDEGELIDLRATFIDLSTLDTHTFLWEVATNNGQVIASRLNVLPGDADQNGTNSLNDLQILASNWQRSLPNDEPNNPPQLAVAAKPGRRTWDFNRRHRELDHDKRWLHGETPTRSATRLMLSWTNLTRRNVSDFSAKPDRLVLATSPLPPVDAMRRTLG